MTEEKDRNETAAAPGADVVSTTEAARQLGVSVRTVQLWVEAGKLAAWKTAGNHRRIYQQSIDDYKAGRGSYSSDLQQKDGAIQPDEDSARNRRKTDGDSPILIIEDERTTQVYYETMLQLLEVESPVEVVSDGIRGLIALGRLEPWLVIVDINMPELDGVEVVKALQQRGFAERMMVLVISNVPRDEALQQGMPEDYPFYPKPISLDDFSQALQEAREMYEQNQKRFTEQRGSEE